MKENIKRKPATKRRLRVLVIILVATIGALIYWLHWAANSQPKVYVFDHSEFEPSESDVKAQAENGVLHYQLQLGAAYLENKYGGGINYLEAEKWLKKAANNDINPTPENLSMRSSAMKFLASMYKEGKGVPKDYSEAMRWYLSAAKIGSESAGCGVGDLYYLGQGVEKNEKEAEKWWKLPEKDLIDLKSEKHRNNAAAQLQLANVYHNSPCPYPQSTLALEPYRRAAELGNAKAQVSLAIMLRRGKQTPEKVDESSRWLLESANAGEPEAQFLLGRDFSDGKNKQEKDAAKALHWYLKSAESGYRDAHNALGYLFYFGGKGVSLDKREAYFWFSLAEKNGKLTSWASELKQTLEKDLPASDLADITLRAQKWAPRQNP